MERVERVVVEVDILLARPRSRSVFMVEIWDWRLNLCLLRRDLVGMVVQPIEVA